MGVFVRRIVIAGLAISLAILGPGRAAADEEPRDVGGMIRRGEQYETGRGVPEDPRQAATWYRKAAELGSAEAQRRYARLVELGAVSGEERSTALDWYRKAALQGDANAQNQVGRLLAEPLEGEPDVAEAAKWFEKSAAGGYAGGQYNFGRFKLRGIGVAKNVPEAKHWLLAAAKQDYRRAFLVLGDAYTDESDAPDLKEAERWYRTGAEAGDPEAQVSLAGLYLGDHGFTPNPAEAKRWLERAAAQGNRSARRRLVEIQTKSMLPPEIAVLQAKELGEVRRRAEAGDADAQTALAYALRKGDGVERDPAAARAWAEKAAKGEHAAAEYLLGLMALDGDGGPEREKEAAAWYAKAAEHGYGPAMNDLSVAHRLGRGVPKDEAKANELLRKAAEDGVPLSQLSLARGLMDGGGGLPRDLVEAHKWFLACGEAGMAECQHFLGFLYSTNALGKADHAEAVRWYEAASRAGWVGSMINLAHVYESGREEKGRPVIGRDPRKALELYRRAAESGHPLAQYHVGRAFESGELVAKDEAEAAKWYRLAAAQQNAMAQAALARLLERGGGTQADPAEARRLYDKAAKQGHAGARNAMARLKGEAPPPNPLRFAAPPAGETLDEVDERLLEEMRRAVKAIDAYWAENASFAGMTPKHLEAHGFTPTAGIRLGIPFSTVDRCAIVVREGEQDRGWTLEVGKPVPRRAGPLR